MEIPFGQLQDGITSLIEDHGVSCTFTRNTGSTDTQGRRTAGWTELGSTEKLWIQAVNVTDKDMQEQGIVEGSTDVGYQSSDGTPLKETDRVTKAGDPVPYDVVGVQVYPNHIKNWLKQVKK